MDNADLEAIERQIAERKLNEVATVEEKPVAPVINFEKSPIPKGQKEKDSAGELVENAFNQALVHKIANDEDLQNEMLDIAGDVVKNKTNAIRERVGQEEKEAYFNSRKGACDCFGYDEATTEQWAVKFMNFWHNIITAIWIFIGCFTFGPIVFVAKKLSVIVKKTWVAVTIATIIYLMVTVGIPLLTGYLNK